MHIVYIACHLMITGPNSLSDSNWYFLLQLFDEKLSTHQIGTFLCSICVQCTYLFYLLESRLRFIRGVQNSQCHFKKEMDPLCFLLNQNMISLTYKTHMLILHKSILRLHTTAQHSKAKHWPLTWIPPLRLRYLKKSKAKALHVRDCIIFQGKNLLRKENKKDGTGTWSNDPIWSSLALAKLSLLTKAPMLEGCLGGFAQNQNYHKVP